MPREIGPERTHFGDTEGLFTEINGELTRYFWRCIHCGWELGGKNFQNSNKARIHLSGDPTLRTGFISRLCVTAPNEVKQQFATLERTLRAARKKKVKKRKRAKVLL